MKSILFDVLCKQTAVCLRLLRLGLIGEEFKTARLHLLKNLDGCIAWKNPEDAIRQREEIRANREAERLLRQSESVQTSEPDQATEISEQETEEQEFAMSM